MDIYNEKRKVLLVKLAEPLNNSLCMFLQSKGFSVANHHNGSVIDNYETATQLLTQQHFDILVTGISLQGDKDGIQLCAWAKNRLNILAIIWSSHSGFELLDRARQCGINYYVKQSAYTDTDIMHIWHNIYFALPGLLLSNKASQTGNYLHVRPVDNLLKLPGFEKRNTGAIYQETFIKWAEVSHIISYNTATAGEGNNNILICSTAHNKGFIYRTALADIINRLPYYFVRFDKGTIINLHHISARGRSNDIFYIDHLQFKLSNIYKQDVLSRLEMIVHKTI